MSFTNYSLILDANDERWIFLSYMESLKTGIVRYDLDTPSDSIEPLFKTILKHCEAYPTRTKNLYRFKSPLLLTMNISGAYSIGRVYQGVLHAQENVVYVIPLEISRNATPPSGFVISRTWPRCGKRGS